MQVIRKAIVLDEMTATDDGQITIIILQFIATEITVIKIMSPVISINITSNKVSNAVIKMAITVAMNMAATTMVR